MAHHKPSPDTCALVAAQLTAAHMSLISGALAGRKAGTSISLAPNAIEKAYRHFYEFAETGVVKPLEIKA